MTLRILYFATIRDLAGMREETVSLPEGSRVNDLKSHLGKEHPKLIKAFASAIFAVNREFAFDDHPLEEGDEVAIFPPVSGGSGDHPTIHRITREPLDMNIGSPPKSVGSIHNSTFMENEIEELLA